MTDTQGEEPLTPTGSAESVEALLERLDNSVGSNDFLEEICDVYPHLAEHIRAQQAEIKRLKRELSTAEWDSQIARGRR